LADDSSDWSGVGTLIPINQDEFWTVSDTFPDRAASGIAERGFLYYPDNCVGSSAACKLSIVLPGGGGNVTEMMAQGFFEVAAANDIVLLFSQQAYEDQSCFDLTAYTGDDYDTLTGIQTIFFKGMIDRLLEAQDDSTYTYDVTGMTSLPTWTYEEEEEDEGLMDIDWPWEEKASYLTAPVAVMVATFIANL